MISEMEKQLVRYLQQDIEITSRPFQDIATVAGTTEHKVLQMTRDFLNRGWIRKFSAVIRHQKIGFTRNAMVIWSIPEERIEEVGKAMAARREITHCYERTPLFLGKYNLFCVVHLKDTNPESFIRDVAVQQNISDYQILISEEELKKNSMEYFK